MMLAMIVFLSLFLGTEAPVWQEDPEDLQGRDVVCMGLNKVPRPLPESKSFLDSLSMEKLIQSFVSIDFRKPDSAIIWHTMPVLFSGSSRYILFYTGV